MGVVRQCGPAHGGVSAGRVDALVGRLGEPRVRSGRWWEGESFFVDAEVRARSRFEGDVVRLRRAQEEQRGASGRFFERGTSVEGDVPVGAAGREGGGVETAGSQARRVGVEGEREQLRRSSRASLGRRRRQAEERVARFDELFNAPLTAADRQYIDVEWRRRLRANVERTFLNVQAAPENMKQSLWLRARVAELDPTFQRDTVELEVRYQRVVNDSLEDPKRVTVTRRDPEALQEEALQRRLARRAAMDYEVDPDDPRAAALRAVRDRVYGQRERYVGAGPERRVVQEGRPGSRFDESGYDRRVPKTEEQARQASGFEMAQEERRLERQAAEDAARDMGEDYVPPVQEGGRGISEEARPRDREPYSGGVGAYSTADVATTRRRTQPETTPAPRGLSLDAQRLLNEAVSLYNKRNRTKLELDQPGIAVYPESARAQLGEIIREIVDRNTRA